MIPLILRISALIIVLSSCGKLKEPELKSIDNPRAESLGTASTILALDLHYFNPNKSKLQFKSASGHAWLEDKPLGEFTIDTVMTIQPLSDFLLPVRLKVDMSNLLRNSTALLFKKEVSVRIEGTARVGKGGIFIRYPLKYEGKHDIIKLLRDLKTVSGER